MKNIKQAVAAVVDAVTPKPSLAELTERLRAAHVELAEARKITPSEPDGFLGLPDPGKVEPSIACCEKAMKVRDAELAFRQGDSESEEIFAALGETLSAKSDEARKLEVTLKAAQAALEAFDLAVEGDVEKMTAQLRALNLRRRAEDLPGAWETPNNPNMTTFNLRSLLRDRNLAGAAELLRRCPVPGRDSCDLFQARINYIKGGDTKRETARALAAKPSWEDPDAWVAKWLSKDRTGRNEMEERGRELKWKASGYR